MAAPKVDQAYLRAAASAREQLSTLIQQDKLVGPALIRLAFNDSLTYDKASNTCGANGSIRCAAYYNLGSHWPSKAVSFALVAFSMLNSTFFPRYPACLHPLLACRTAKELAQPGNEGLKGAVDHIKGVKAKFPTLSHAGDTLGLASDLLLLLTGHLASTLASRVLGASALVSVACATQCAPAASLGTQALMDAVMCCRPHTAGGRGCCGGGWGPGGATRAGPR